MIVRLTSAVIVGGIHRNAGEEVKVDSALGDSLVRRQLAEPIASKPAQASSPAPQSTLDLAPDPAPDPAPAVDPVLSDETDAPKQEAEQETEPSDTVEPRESETESPGEPSTVPEGDTSSSPSRKRRRR